MSNSKDDERPHQSFLENEETSELIEHALFNLWSVANNLSRIKPRQERFRVTIFGSSRTQSGTEIYEQVKELARRLSELGCDIVTGGGPGLMEAANEGQKIGGEETNTESVGVRVNLPHEQGVNPFATKVYSHQTFFTRLHHFVRLSNAFVVVQGGIGTTLELMMVWQLLQVKHIDDIPLIVLGEMWEDLREWARTHMVEVDEQCASADEVRIPVCADSIEAVVDQIKETKATFDADSSAD